MEHHGGGCSPPGPRLWGSDSAGAERPRPASPAGYRGRLKHPEPRAGDSEVQIADQIEQLMKAAPDGEGQAYALFGAG